MPRPNCNVITYSGVFGSAAAPVEQWSFSIKTGPLVFTDPAERQVYANRRRDQLRTSLLWSGMPNYLTLTNVRVAQTAAGLVIKDAGGAYAQSDAIAQEPGGTSGRPPYPLQTALCVSLTTFRAGASGKGRFFLPYPGYTLQADHRVEASTVQTLVNNLKTWLNTINDDEISPGLADGDVVVASDKGFLTRVTGVRVGRVPDTMRSRRSDAIEGYISAAL